MDKAWQRALTSAYRPLQLRGMMIEGQYRLPAKQDRTTAAKRPMMLFALVAGLFRHRRRFGD
jgi:hypothetical protein